MVHQNFIKSAGLELKYSSEAGLGNTACQKTAPLGRTGLKCCAEPLLGPVLRLRAPRGQSVVFGHGCEKAGQVSWPPLSGNIPVQLSTAEAWWRLAALGMFNLARQRTPKSTSSRAVTGAAGNSARLPQISSSKASRTKVCFPMLHLRGRVLR